MARRSGLPAACRRGRRDRRRGGESRRDAGVAAAGRAPDLPALVRNGRRPGAPRAAARRRARRRDRPVPRDRRTAVLARRAGPAGAGRAAGRARCPRRRPRRRRDLRHELGHDGRSEDPADQPARAGDPGRAGQSRPGRAAAGARLRRGLPRPVVAASRDLPGAHLGAPGPRRRSEDRRPGPLHAPRRDAPRPDRPAGDRPRPRPGAGRVVSLRVEAVRLGLARAAATARRVPGGGHPALRRLRCARSGRIHEHLPG